jgi:hypothetical protein
MVHSVGMVVAAGVLVLVGCGGGNTTSAEESAPASAEDTETSTTATTTPAIASVDAPALSYIPATGEGAARIFTVEMTDSTDGELRVDISENEVAGVGDMKRAAAWNSVIVASLLTGQLPAKTFRFVETGYIDGPSAGAVQTVAVLSLLLGDELRTDVAMTGTINPDGTVGPVGGIPEKLTGASAEGYKRVLIPMGLRNSYSEKEDAVVDVVALGAELGLEVKEVSTVYEAYTEFTGKEVPRLAPSSNVRLSNVAYDRLKAKVSEFVAKYEGMAAKFGQLPTTIAERFLDVAQETDDLANRAVELSNQGLQAGAYSLIMTAYGQLSALVFTGEAVELFISDGISGLNTKIDEARAIDTQVIAFLDNLKTYDPQTVSEAASLMNAYGGIFDAFSLSGIALGELKAISDAFNEGSLELGDAVAALTLPLIYLSVAGVQVEGTKALFDVGRDLGGPEIEADVNLAGLANLFRKGSDANWEAFRAISVERYSTKLNISAESVIDRFRVSDVDIELSLDQSRSIDGLANYLGADKPNAQFAQLGYAISNYSRNAVILAKYESLGVLDDEGNLVDVQAPSAFSDALSLAKDQLTANIGLLRDAGIDPALEVGGLEAANIDREGEVTDKFEALSTYWGAYLSTRALTYLAGVETKGLNR